MIGLDTCVLVRYFTQDDARQTAIATKLIDSLTPTTPGFIPVAAMIELLWVLRSSYGKSREQLKVVVRRILASTSFVVESTAVIWRALRVFETTGIGFCDCVVGRTCEARGCEYTATFDKAAARTAGFRLLKDA